MRDVQVLPESQTRHIYFHDCMANDIEEHSRGQPGKVQYDLEEQFGIKRDDLYRDFACYTDVFPVQREAENT